jgi:hypothetical protein
MLRVCLEILLPLLLPTALYLLWVTALRPSQPAAAMSWAGMPWAWLGGVGVALLAMVLALFAFSSGQQDGTYVPAHLEHGRIVPGHFVPKALP